jgi:hypothetical protein
MHRIYILLFIVFLKSLCLGQIYFNLKSNEDSTNIPLASIKITRHDSVLGFANSGLDKFSVVRNIKSPEHANVKITATGYETYLLEDTTLHQYDTLTIAMKAKEVQLDEFQIISYKVPLIDREPEKTKWWKHKKKLPPTPPELIIEYTREELVAKQILEKGYALSKPEQGTYVRTPGTGYLKLNIQYPEKCTEAGIGEKIYFKLHYNGDGRLSRITLLKGNDPALVFAAWKAILGSTQMTNMYNYNNKPFAIILPIHFRVQ